MGSNRFGRYFSRVISGINPLWIVAPLGLLLTVYFFLTVRFYSQERLKSIFEGDAALVADAVERTIDYYGTEVDALHVHFEINGSMDSRQFGAFAAPMLAKTAGIRAFEWVPQVADKDRNDYEAAERAAGRQAFTITELNDSRRFVPAGRRDYYYPVHYIQPLAGHEQAVGFDLGAEDVRRQVLEQAAVADRLYASAPLNLAEDPQTRLGYLLAIPVHKIDAGKASDEERETALQGFMLGVLHGDDMLKAALISVQRGLSVQLVDCTDDQRGQVVASVDSGGPGDEGNGLTWLTAPPPLKSSHYFTFAGRHWQVEAQATPGYIRGKYDQSYWAILPVGGLVTCIISLITNSLFNQIAARRRIDNALKASEGELIRKNEELASALQAIKQAQTRMIQQEKLAGIGQLAAGVAHEINNPLGYVSINVETLEQYFASVGEIFDSYQDFRAFLAANGNPAVQEKINDLVVREEELDLKFIFQDLTDLFTDTKEGISRMSSIVQGMRIFSRVDQRREFELYDVNKGIESTLIVAHNEIKFRAHVETDLNHVPPIEAAGGEINQVLLNLIINAVQAVKEKHADGMGRIRLCSGQEGEYCFYTVEDNGIGISAGNLSSIFNPFFTTKPVGQGTGLGLSISYDIIVNRHGGEIKVESMPGIGTKFTVKLPLRQIDG